MAACSLPFDAAVDCYGAFIVEDRPEGLPKAMQPILHLAPNRRYSWMLDVDGHEDDSWQLSFETRQTQAAPGMRR